MSEYIKKEDAEASARALLFCYGSDNIPDEQLDEYAEEFMNDDNTIVDVVRCKDCKHHEELLNNNDGNVLCWVHGLDVIVDRNGYCNYGEREEQEHGASKKSR